MQLVTPTEKPEWTVSGLCAARISRAVGAKAAKVCINPSLLNNGLYVRCRNCWQCRSRHVDDWAGRCIAESKTSKACNFVTLTYGTNEDGEKLHPRAVLLTYSDIQKYLKKLRKAGYPCRYFCVGEYGSLKGRAHWHLIIFWQDKVPPHTLNKRIHEQHWVHGFSQWEKVNYTNIRYCAKYMRKDAMPGRQAHFSMSKKPPIGAEYFRRLAEKYVDQGLAPQDLTYIHPEVIGTGKKPRKFTLFGKSADIYLQAYIDIWAEKRGGHFPQSDLIDDWMDKKYAYESDLVREKPWVQNYYPEYLPYTDVGQATYAPTLKSWYVQRDGRRLWWSYDDEGNRVWREKVQSQTDGTWRRLRAICLEREIARRQDDLEMAQ